MLKPLAIKKPFFKKPILVSPVENPSVSTGNFSTNNLVGEDPVQLLTSSESLYKSSPGILKMCSFTDSMNGCILPVTSTQKTMSIL